MMNYKGYHSRIEFDEEAEMIKGEVINIRDAISFKGETVEELKQAFHDSVDQYLELCAKRGESPARQYSGRFVVRSDPELHMRIAVAAKKKRISINALVNELLASALDVK
jgi:predicted HicB family RNase H-like nuclease